MPTEELVPIPSRPIDGIVDRSRDEIIIDNFDVGAADEKQWRIHWRIIAKRKWLIIQIVVIVLCLVWLGLSRLRPTYEAVVTIQIDREDKEFFRNSGIVINALRDEDYLRTQLQLLKSPTLARNVVKALDLDNNPDLMPQGPSTLTELLLQFANRSSQAKPPQPQKSLERSSMDVAGINTVDQKEIKQLSPYVNFLLSRLDINPVTQTRLVQMRLQHHNPELATKIVNTFAETFAAENMTRRKDTSSNTADFLQKQIASLQAEIRKSEEKLVNYSKTNQISLEDKQNTVVERLMTLNRTLLEAEAERKNTEAAYQISRQGDTDSLPEILNDNTVSTLNGRILELNQKRADLSAQFTAEWPEVKALDEQIKQLQEAVKVEKQRIVNSIALKYQAALTRERSLRTDFEASKGETLQQNRDAITYRMIQQEIDNNKNLLNQLLQRAKEVNVSAAAESNNIHVTDYAATPEVPIAPRSVTTLMLTFLLSMFGSIGLCYALEYVNNTINTVEDVDTFLRLPTLGVIPSAGHMMSLEKKVMRMLPFASAKKKVNSNEITALVVSPKNSSISENYRQLRTSILMSTANTPPRTILVSSSIPSEGKTTTAVNMAISLAQTGASVLIIDCDMRRPSVQNALGCPNDVGLSRFLSNNINPEDVIQHDVQVKNLSVLPCGPVPPNPAELLGSVRMAELIQYCATTYDHVIVDTPPVISFADAIILSRLSDGVVLVVNSGKSDRNSVRLARRYFSDANARFLGVVLNNVDFNNSEYGYYRSYYNHYYGKN